MRLVPAPQDTTKRHATLVQLVPAPQDKAQRGAPTPSSSYPDALARPLQPPTCSTSRALSSAALLRSACSTSQRASTSRRWDMSGQYARTSSWLRRDSLHAARGVCVCVRAHLPFLVSTVSGPASNKHAGRRPRAQTHVHTHTHTHAHTSPSLQVQRPGPTHLHARRPHEPPTPQWNSPLSWNSCIARVRPQVH